MVAVCFFQYKILYQSKIFVVVFIENFVVYIQVVENKLEPRELSKSVLTFCKDYRVGTK